MVNKTTTGNHLKSIQNSSKSRSIVVANAKFAKNVNKNNENLHPLEHESCEIENKSPVKVPKIRRKKKNVS